MTSVGRILFGAIIIAVAAGCSSGGSGGSEDTPTPRLVCTTSYGGGCTCKMQNRTTDAPAFDCSADSIDDSICCADSGYPSSGSCVCEKPSNAVSCWTYQYASNKDRTCTCGSSAPSGSNIYDVKPTSSCSPVGNTFCCADSEDCYCYANTDSCYDSQTKVSSCSPKPGKCSSSETGVKSCSGAVSSSGTGSAGSSGGEKCSPGSGACSNCKCGQSCFATAVCSSCEPRCGYTCKTDQDCKDLQNKYNLTVSYSKCVKTSPNYDIYKCE